MQKKDVAAKPDSNVIHLHMDATFFFERAVQCLDRYNYDKALKYFRKAMEYEPDNPVNYCNMAGILSEIGRYEESNELLRKVLEEIDPTMTECYFFMANNYMNMEDYFLAEQALIHYLERDPEGQYLEDAEEMMEFLSYELNRPVTFDAIRSQLEFTQHDQARIYMEEGRFEEAIQLLEEIISEKPDFIPAKNNLALAYYYTGEIEKGFQIIEEVLDQEHGNIHALCNLAVFLQHSGEYRAAARLIYRLSKTVPFTEEHLFKLAMTLGILGEHESAYPHFMRILKMDEAADPSLLHYAAVAAASTKRYAQAIRLWKQAERLDPESDVPKFYISQVEKAMNGEEVLYSYHYHLPFEEQFRLLTSKLPYWEEKWQRVIDQALAHMKNRFDIIELYDMQTLWIEFLTKIYPNVPVIRKTNGWAGALEYLTAKMHRHAISYRELSERYEVSESTIRKNVARVDEICGLSEKMNAIFPHIQKSLRNLGKS